MGPKKGEPVKRDDFWRTDIEEAVLNDESWSAQVVIMEVAGSHQDRMYLNKFEVFAAEGKRCVVKNICKSETMFMVNQLGGEKKVKDDNLRIFEEGQAFLKEKKDIPTDIQALIVKHLILKMKEEYLFVKKQQLFVRDGMRRESKTMIDKSEVRGTVCVHPAEPVPPTPPPQPQGKGKKGEPEPVAPVDEPEEGKKYNTVLRVRGEEWRDKVYVDDFPVDGPNLYVAVTGFMEPELAGCLIKIGVPITAIFQVRIDLVTQPIPSSLARPTKRGQSQTDVLMEYSLKYWEYLQKLRINKDTADEYNNTAFVVFPPPYWTEDDLSGNPEKIYDELCFLMYDIQDLTRQRSHYLENMDIINIPIVPKDETYEHYYHTYIDDLPLECCTTYSVLDSILQAVCRKQELSDGTTKTSLSDGFTLNNDQPSSPEFKMKKAETLVKDVFSALNATNSYKKAYRLTYGEESETQKDPIIIKFGDFAKFKTFHLDSINLDDTIFSMLLGMPINRLWHRQECPQDESEAKINFHVNVLLSCFDRPDVETAELNRLLHILACRKLYNNRSSLKKNHLPSQTISEFKKKYLRRSVLAEPLPKVTPFLVSSSTTRHSFPSITKVKHNSVSETLGETEEQRLKFLFDCPDISELVSPSEIENKKPNDHIIDDFDVFEDFTYTRAFQVLREAFVNFNCLDYKYCEVTDTFNLMFFNSHDNDGIDREEWRSHLPTPVCLQDFFDFVLEEHYDWIQNEENLYEQKLAHDSQSQSTAVDPFALQSCVEKQDVEMELLIEGSLKFQVIVAKDEAALQTAEASTPKTGDSESVTISSRLRDSKSSRKHTLVLPSTSCSNLGNESSQITIPSKPFQGYDLSERRVEVFGKDGTFYSKDGTRVSSRYSFLIPMNLENIGLCVVPGNGLNEFWVHRSLGDLITPEVTDACESFRITSKDEVAFYFKKEDYRIPIPLMTESSLIDTVPLKKKETVIKVPSETEMPVIYETKTFHSLCVTWPNGLITATVHADNSPTLSHIKQYHVEPSSIQDEEMRCISLNGEVIIFKNSGIIEVLRSDGTYIKITKYESKIIETNTLSTGETPVVEPIKPTKPPTKSQGVDKPVKLSSKTSKNITLKQDNEPSDLAPVNEYELIIDEFEIIETSGLRQLWINECSFDIEKLLIRTATDYCLGEVFSRRMDGTQVLLNKDGIQVVTFPNGTRIITQVIVEDDEIYPEWTEEEICCFELLESQANLSLRSKHSMSQKSNYSNLSRYSRRLSHPGSAASKKLSDEERKQVLKMDGYISIQTCYTIEHEIFSSVTVNKSTGKVTIDSPNDTSVTFTTTNNYYEVNLDPATVASFDGQDLNIDYSGCVECNSKTTCKIKICQNDNNSAKRSQQCWLHLEDSFGKRIAVNEEGAIQLDERELYNTSFDVGGSETTMQVSESNTNSAGHGKCRQKFSSKEMRFFILRRDLTCSELVHRLQLEEYVKPCRYQPWCSINEYDTFGDHRRLMSVLSPVPLTETEKWVMASKLSSQPKSLKYKDLKKDGGKGFYHWMRPYKRFEPKPQTFERLTPRLPRAFTLRILEKQWRERDRIKLKGAKELLRAVLKYRDVMESDCENILHVPVVDLRSETERNVFEIVQALGHRIYKELKERLAADIENNAKLNITTKPLPPKFPEEMDEGLEEAESSLLAAGDSGIQEAQVEDMSPNLKRYWRIRAEQYKEEQFYLHLLRDGSVPPYFRNVLGGAIWWEVNNAAGIAVERSERRKMKCACDEATADDDGVLPFM